MYLNFFGGCIGFFWRLYVFKFLLEHEPFSAAVFIGFSWSVTAFRALQIAKLSREQLEN